MPQRNLRLLKKTLLPFGLLAMAFAIVRRRPDDWEYEPHEDDTPEVAQPPLAAPAARGPGRRIALAAAFTTLFFAGASFTAGAGDRAVKLIEADAAPEAAELAAAPEQAQQPDPEAATPAADAAPAPEATSAEPAPAEAAPTETLQPEPAAPPEPAPAPEAAVPAGGAAPTTGAGEPEASDALSAATPAAAPAAPRTATGSAPAPTRVAAAKRAATQQPAAKPRRAKAQAQGTKQWVVERAAAPAPQAPEIEEGTQATVWLNRALPDPTPPSERLSRAFAKQLAAATKRYDADWAAVLALLRAQGERGAEPATARQLDTLAARVGKSEAWNAALALSGRTTFADRAAALADLYRFVGLETLVSGYAAAKDRLAKKLLNTTGIFVYEGGRQDIVAGRIDVRVLALVGYLAERHGSVTLSSLIAGHRVFARPGVVSAHMYGLAVDVAAVGGTPIAGNQQPGGVTEAAVRSVLLLPSELQPRQVISLLGLGGPSFPLRDHGDHIHVGY